MSEETIIDEYDAGYEDAIKPKPLLSKTVIRSHDDFMYRTDYDNRKNLNSGSFQTSDTSSMLSFVGSTPSKIESQPNSIRTVANNKSSTPVQSSPLFHRTKTSDLLQPNDDDDIVNLGFNNNKKQAPPFTQRRSITSQEMRSPFDIKKSPKLVQNHFGLPKTELKTKTNEIQTPCVDDLSQRGQKKSKSRLEDNSSNVRDFLQTPLEIYFLKILLSRIELIRVTKCQALQAKTCFCE